LRQAAGIAALAMAVACGPLAAPPVVEKLPRPIDSIALFPVVFTDALPDPRCDPYIGHNLRYEVQRQLGEKGYRVVRVIESPRPSERWQQAPPLGEFAPVAHLAPSGVDAILLVWVERYHDATLCDRDVPRVLEMTATAALYDLEAGAEVWRRRATAADSSMGGVLDTWLEWRVPIDLAGSLLVTLPRAPQP
jgi:hypothetical protein